MRIPKVRVFQRSKNSWSVEFYWKSQRFPWPAGQTEQAAKILKSKIELCIHEGRFEGRRSDVEPEPSQAAMIATKRLTMDKLLDEFLVTKARKKSYSFYDHTASVIRPTLGKKYVDMLTERDVKMFVDARRTRTVVREKKRVEVAVATATWNRTLVVLKMALEHARALGYIKTNPADGLKLEREIKRREFFIERKQFDNQLLPKVEAGYQPAAIGAADTGGRKSEVLGLDWPDVDLDAKTITFRDTKNGDDRTVPMTKRLHATLKELPSRFLGGAVFRDPELTDEKGVPLRLTSNRLRRPFESAVKAAGLVQIVKNEDGKREEVSFHFHDLRHSYASWQVQAGTPLNTVRALLGHKSLEMTLRYAHLAPEHLKVAADVLDGLDSKSTTQTPHSATASADGPASPKS